MNNVPIDHHFVPKFYLKRWGNPLHSGNFYSYSKPYGETIKGKWVSPAQTGYESHLYTFKSGQTGDAINLEIDLLKSVDDVGSNVLNQLEQNILPKSGSAERIGWSRFLICQQMRTPEDIDQLKSMASEQWAATVPELQAGYDQWREGNGPPLIEDFLNTNFPHQDSELAAEIAKKVLIHSRIAELISSLRWRVIKFDEDCHPLLTSDRPVWISATLKEKDDFLWMPINPRMLFVAAIDDALLNILSARPRMQLAKATNEIIAKTAFRYLFSIDNSVTEFVAKRFATTPHSRLLELVARHRGLTIKNQRSPSALG